MGASSTDGRETRRISDPETLTSYTHRSGLMAKRLGEAAREARDAMVRVSGAHGSWGPWARETFSDPEKLRGLGFLLVSSALVLMSLDAAL